MKERERTRKKRKDKASSDSSSSESESWVEAKKLSAKSSRKSKKEQKEKKRKTDDRKEKKKRRTSQPRQLKAMSSSPKAAEDKGFPKARHEELAKTLKVDGKISPEQLEGEDWMVDLAHRSRKKIYSALRNETVCRRVAINMTSSKDLCRTRKESDCWTSALCSVHLGLT